LGHTFLLLWLASLFASTMKRSTFLRIELATLDYFPLEIFKSEFPFRLLAALPDYLSFHF
jgi:hypothetical protein